MSDPVDKSTWAAIGFLGCGALLVVVAALQMGPMADDGTTLASPGTADVLLDHLVVVGTTVSAYQHGTNTSIATNCG